MPGNTGSEMSMLLFLISLTFNLVSICVGGTAFCCLYSEVLLWPCKSKKRAQHDVYYTAKYGERVSLNRQMSSVGEQHGCKEI